MVGHLSTTTKEVTETFDPNLMVSSKFHGLLETQLEIDVCGGSELSEQEFESTKLDPEVFDTESGNMDTIAQVRSVLDDS